MSTAYSEKAKELKTFAKMNTTLTEYNRLNTIEAIARLQYYICEIIFSMLCFNNGYALFLVKICALTTPSVRKPSVNNLMRIVQKPFEVLFFFVKKKKLMRNVNAAQMQ